MDWFEHWALSLGVFIPLAGAAVMMVVPRANEEAHKVIALLASLASLAVGVYHHVDFDYAKAGQQFTVNQAGS